MKIILLALSLAGAARGADTCEWAPVPGAVSYQLSNTVGVVTAVQGTNAPISIPAGVPLVCWVRALMPAGDYTPWSACTRFAWYQRTNTVTVTVTNVVTILKTNTSTITVRQNVTNYFATITLTPGWSSALKTNAVINVQLP